MSATTYDFSDEFGCHSHSVSVPGQPFDPKKPVRCEACINMLTFSLDAWQTELTRRHKLPEGFWNGYLRGWEK